MFEIKNRKLGTDYPPYVIAELSANHNGDIIRAKEIMRMSKDCGADAVKIQTYTADTMTIDSQKEDFQINSGLWKGYNLHDLYKWAETPFEWHKDLFDYAKSIDITCFSTPFDETAVNLLEDLNTPAYKIASFEAIDLPLIKYVAETKKPMIISTGMADFNEISEAVDIARSSGCNDLALLHCVSSYPAPEDAYNLRTITDLKEKFDTLVGLSDHTLGINVALASIPLGSCIIEKHVTLSRKDKGPDSEFSLESTELQALCSGVKGVWKSLGKVNYELNEVEKSSIKFRRSIYAIENIKKGESITNSNIRRIRPGYGLPPKYYDELINKTAKVNIERGTPISWDLID
tara:strand:+ start:5858 stop:6898 length:1041 start_codon:yes stop_codon:yes gene_type:complete